MDFHLTKINLLGSTFDVLLKGVAIDGSKVRQLASMHQEHKKDHTAMKHSAKMIMDALGVPAAPYEVR